MTRVDLSRIIMRLALMTGFDKIFHRCWHRNLSAKIFVKKGGCLSHSDRVRPCYAHHEVICPIVPQQWRRDSSCIARDNILRPKLPPVASLISLKLVIGFIQIGLPPTFPQMESAAIKPTTRRSESHVDYKEVRWIRHLPDPAGLVARSLRHAGSDRIGGDGAGRDARGGQRGDSGRAY